jgi:antitoxin (DNA-binding transcriptional repressor) of toxin-antitoxin stability system
MKTIPISKAVRPLADYAAELGDDVVVVTQGNKPVAAVVSLKNVDRESLVLSAHPEFLKIINRSRRAIAQGKTFSLAEMKEMFGTRKTGDKALNPKPKKRRG